MGRISILYDVLNKITIHSKLASYKTPEKKLSDEHIKYLCELNKETNLSGNIKDLFIFDRGYPSTYNLFFFQHIKKDFLMRCSRLFLSEVNIAAQNGKVDQIITINAFEKNRKTRVDIKKSLPHLDENSQVQLRVLTFTLKGGEKEILITSLLDQKSFPPLTLFKLYGKRWDVEEGYKFHKNIVEMENFSGKSVLTKMFLLDY